MLEKIIKKLEEICNAFDDQAQYEPCDSERMDSDYIKKWVDEFSKTIDELKEKLPMSIPEFNKQFEDMAQIGLVEEYLDHELLENEEFRILWRNKRREMNQEYGKYFPVVR